MTSQTRQVRVVELVLVERLITSLIASTQDDTILNLPVTNSLGSFAELVTVVNLSSLKLSHLQCL